MKIKEGGQTEKLQSKIVEIQCSATGGKYIELWICDEKGNESLSYLSIDEAVTLAEELKAAIKRRIDHI